MKKGNGKVMALCDTEEEYAQLMTEFMGKRKNMPWELCKYNLSENYDGKTAMIFGEVYRFKGEWKFGAIGEPTNDNSIGELAQRYQ